MSPIAVGFAAPFRWLGKAFDVGRRNPKALFGAIALALAVVFGISVLQMGLQAGAQGSGTGVAAVMAITTVISWLVMPLVFGGLFRVLDATDRGLPVQASDVFNTFAPGQGRKRLVLTNLVFSLTYLALLALLLLTSLGQFFREYFAIILAVPPGSQPDEAAILELFRATPPTALLWVPAAALAIGAWMHASMFGLATAAFREASVAECVVAGWLAVLRNIIPLLAVSVAVMFGGFALAMVLALVMGLVMALLSVGGLILVLPLMAMALLAFYALMFGFYYHGWREIFGEPGAEPPAAPGELAA